MELRDYLNVLRRRWLSVLVVTLAVFVLAVGGTMLLTPKYTSTTRLFFAVQGGESVTDLAQGSNYAEKQMTSYAEVATSPLVLTPVIRRLQLQVNAEDLAKTVTATVPVNTVIIELTATDSDPARSAAIVNAVGATLADVAVNLSPARSDGSEAVRATVLTPAAIPREPSSPVLLRNVAIGLALGVVLGVGIALLRQLLETKIRSESDVAGITQRSLLGVIAYDSSAPAHPVVMHDDPLGARSEAVRRLRTNLQFVDLAEEAKSIVITSSIPGEGKSTTAINLGVSLADAGLKVLLVDADLRRPSISEYLGIEGRVGLTTVLIGKADVDDVVQPWHETTLDVMPAGQIPPNPSELLGSKAMSALLARLATHYDMVILDSSPLLPVTDAIILSKVAGGTLVVVGADRVHRPQLRSGLESLETVGANVLGIVLNKVARKDADTYGYYAGYAPTETSDPKHSLPEVDGPDKPSVVTAAASRTEQ